MREQSTPAGQPIIEAEQFILRPLELADTGVLALYAGDERVARSTSSIPHPLPPGSTEAFVERALAADRTEDVWAIDGTAAGTAGLLGVVSLERMEHKSRVQSEIGYWVAPAFWNAGVASRAVAALVAANPQGCDTIFAEVFQDNPFSARVITNAGFEYLGDAEAYSVARAAAVPTWTYMKKYI
ncbi:GNAT family N-acetyltransferase [Alphaproteobacteria bacterium KMM 3653]|uniref:GNAT family N-acetyltransferase n=1 Tax=Harenicola maris TaxID=2841044 RepID=A0AAP2CQM4_9RHOB|nr:GNAT family N-acetyltransferase [Harenicola maris]